MARAVMTLWILFVLGMNCRVAGFPVYDYDPAMVRVALRASLAKLNSQPLSPYLFRVTRSSLKRLSMQDHDSATLELEFRVRETECPRDAGAQPASCDFQRG